MIRRIPSMLALAVLFALLFPLFAAAQPIQQTVRVIIVPDRPSWEYTVGEKPTFTITVLQFGNPLDGVTVNYKLGPEKMDPAKS